MAECLHKNSSLIKPAKMHVLKGFQKCTNVDFAGTFAVLETADPSNLLGNTGLTGGTL